MLFLTAAASCVREAQVPTAEPEAEAYVPVLLCFDEPVFLHAHTKADPGMEMDDLPAITSIHVAVFGDSGYLKDYARAVPCTVVTDANNVQTVFPSDATVPHNFALYSRCVYDSWYWEDDGTVTSFQYKPYKGTN